MGLLKTLIDRTFKANVTWMGLHNDPQNLPVVPIYGRTYSLRTLSTNASVSQITLKSVKGSKIQPLSGVKPQETPEFHYKIPYISHFSVIVQNKIRKLANRFCRNTGIKLVFTTFKIKTQVNVKDALPEGPRTHVVYKFSCTSCDANLLRKHENLSCQTTNYLINLIHK